MKDNIRGIECSLYNGRIEDLLLFLANKPFDFYVRWCLKIDDKQMILPKSSCNFRVLPEDLKKLAKKSIWELILHVYPVGSNMKLIETYDDYVSSSCSCYLIFYDCGLLDIYVKEVSMRNQLYDLLLSLQAKDIEFITDESDDSTHMLC